MDFDVTELKKFADERGFLIEFLKASELKKRHKSYGQNYCGTIHPNALRGNHYHKIKEEWITALAGKLTLVLEDINTKERKEVTLDADATTIRRVRIGCNVAHAIKNNHTSPAVFLAYTIKEYNQKELDQNFYKVI